MDRQEVPGAERPRAATGEPPGEGVHLLEDPFSADDILDPHILGNVTIDTDLIARPLREYVDPSMLRLPVPVNTVSPDLPVFGWSHIEYPVQEAIIKVISDDLESFHQACVKLHLFQKEVREFTQAYTDVGRRPSYTPSRDAIAYGWDYLKLFGLEKYSHDVEDLCLRSGGSSPIHIDYSDLELLYIPERRVAPIQFGFPTQETIRDSTTKGIFSPRTGSVLIAFKLTRPATLNSINSSNTPIFRIEHLRLPAGAIIVGPEGRKTLRETGIYTITYPPGSREVPDADTIQICENGLTTETLLDHDEPKGQGQGHGQDQGQGQGQDQGQDQGPGQVTNPEPQLQTPRYSLSVVNPAKLELETSFFEDAFLDPLYEAERAMADSLIPPYFLDRFSALALSEPSQSQKQPTPTPNPTLSDTPHHPSSESNSHHAAPLTPTAPLSSAGGQPICAPSKDLAPLGEDLNPVLPKTFSPGTELPLQPRLDSIGLIPNTEDPKVSDLVSKNYQALVQFRLPKGYFVVSPCGYKMNFDTFQGQLEDGVSSSGFGGEYTILPPGGFYDARSYRDMKMDNSGLFRMAFEKHMAVFCNDSMFPRLLGQGLHQFSLQSGKLEISCKDGIYDLTMPLEDPELLRRTSKSTEPKAQRKPTSTSRVSRQAVATAPKKVQKKAATNPANQRRLSLRASQNEEESDIDMDESDDNEIGEEDEEYVESSSRATSQVPKKSTQKRKRTLDSVTADTTPEAVRPTKKQATGTPLSSNVVTRVTRSSHRKAQNNAQAQTQSPSLRVSVLVDAATRAERTRQLNASSSGQVQAELSPQLTTETETNTQSKEQSKVELKSQPEVQSKTKAVITSGVQTRASARLQAASTSESPTQSETRTPEKPTRIVLVGRKSFGPASSPDQPSPGSGIASRTRSASRAQLEENSEPQPQPKKVKINVKPPAKALPKAKPQPQPQNRAQTRSQTKAQERTTRSNRRYSAEF
ncbi:hypothetical protein F5Y06DRAFT_293711 [Hypoxylon sp. FL0890]|nr:hypothetical protein F5Y06DRAFT_293711 [Hypoxylon sp. FL0890]